MKRRNRAVRLAFFAPVMAILAVACEDQNSSPARMGNREAVIEGTGTMAQMFTGFGEYVIKSDDGQVYAALDLPAEFKIEGLRVSFAVVEESFGDYWIPEAPVIVSIIEIRALPVDGE